MKNSLSLIIIVLFFACGNQTEQEETSIDSMSNEELSLTEIPEQEESSQDPGQILFKVVENDPGLTSKLKKYMTMLKGKINSEEEIIEIFELRKKIIAELDELIYEYLSQNGEYDHDLEQALNYYGMQGTYAEGMYFGLDVAPVLEKEIKEYASEEFNLNIAFNNAVATAYQSEYPYDSMVDEMEIVKIGEKIMKKYPRSETAEKIEEEFMRAVWVFTDFHVVTHSGRDDETYIVGGLDVDMYPAGSYKGNFEAYVKELPNSKYTKVIQAILDNPSEISYENTPVYLVTVDIESDSDKTNEKLFNFVDSGIDIPHRIIVRRGDKADYALVYRFFSDKEKADKALDFIKQTHEDAEIIVIDRKGQIQ